MKQLLFKIILVGLFSTTANADYVRIWRGFALEGLAHEDFVHGLNHVLFPATSALTFTDAKLRTYMPVIIANEDLHVSVPDEVALLSYESEDAYRAYRSTAAGKHYGALHGDFFDPKISHSLVPQEYEGELQPDHAYEMVSSRSSWQKHMTYFRIVGGFEGDQDKFLKGLDRHAQQVKDQKPVRYYLLVADEYAIEYIQVEKPGDMSNMPDDFVLVSYQLANKSKIQVAGGLNFPIERTTAKNLSRDVWQNHMDSWADRDLDGIMRDYTEESVVIYKDHVYRGKKEIRQAYERLFKKFDNAIHSGVDRVTFENNIVYITWFAEFDGVKARGTDTYVIKNGKILSQTITD